MTLVYFYVDGDGITRFGSVDLGGAPAVGLPPNSLALMGVGI